MVEYQFTVCENQTAKNGEGAARGRTIPLIKTPVINRPCILHDLHLFEVRREMRSHRDDGGDRGMRKERDRKEKKNNVEITEMTWLSGKCENHGNDMARRPPARWPYSLAMMLMDK